MHHNRKAAAAMSVEYRSSEDLLWNLEKVKSEMAGNHSEAGIWSQRQELQDMCRRLLLSDLPAALNGGVERDLWNMAFHQQIKALQSALKKSRGGTSAESAQANLSLFLDFAQGFFMQLLQELSAKFCIDVPFHACGRWFGIVTDVSVGIKSLEPSKAYVCQFCLCHLGDIGRYRHQHRQAGLCYRYAAQLRPCNGHPYHQLGILAAAEDQPLKAVMHYCRSLCIRYPYPPADSNLSGLLAKYSSMDSLDVKFPSLWLSFLSCAGRAIKSGASVSEDIDDITPLIRPNVEDHITTGGAGVESDLLSMAVSCVYLLSWVRPYDTDNAHVREVSEACWQQVAKAIMGVFDMLASHLKTQATVLAAVSIFIECLTLNWSSLSALMPNNIIASISNYLAGASQQSPSAPGNPLLNDLDGFLLMQAESSSYSHPATCYGVLKNFCDHLVRLDDRRIHCSVHGMYVYHEPHSSLLSDTFTPSAIGSGRPPAPTTPRQRASARSVPGSSTGSASTVRLAAVFSTPRTEQSNNRPK